MTTPRRKNEFWREGKTLGPYAHAQTTVTVTTPKLVKTSNREVKIQKVYYHNATGLAQSATDFFVIQLKKGATVLASWSTETGQQGTIAADTFVEMVLNATPINLKLDAASELHMVLTKTGVQTLPVGEITIHGEEL